MILVWIIISPIAAFVIAVIVLAILPMNIPREPEREGRQDRKAARAYARQGHSPVFVMERYFILRALARWKPHGPVVDIGSGPGFLAAAISRHYPAARVVGLDNNNEMINIARSIWQREPYDIEFTKADAHKLPFADGAVDFIVSSLSLHHWTDAKMVFKEIRRVLKPGGRFLIFDLRRDGPRLFYYALKLGQALSSADIRRTNGAVGSFWSSYTPPELEAALSRVDFEAVRIEPRFGLMFASGRRAEKALDLSFSPL
jgi:ubiquinone/menaquinone biosynthesis C-methylase UbiE